MPSDLLNGPARRGVRSIDEMALLLAVAGSIPQWAYLKAFLFLTQESPSSLATGGGPGLVWSSASGNGCTPCFDDECGGRSGLSASSCAGGPRKRERYRFAAIVVGPRFRARKAW